MHQNVDLAIGIYRSLNNILPTFGRRDRVIIWCALTARLLDHLHRLIGSRARLTDPIHRGAEVIDHHLGTFRRHELADFPANTTATTGHHGDFAFEYHDRLLPEKTKRTVKAYHIHSGSALPPRCVMSTHAHINGPRGIPVGSVPRYGSRHSSPSRPGIAPRSFPRR